MKKNASLMILAGMVFLAACKDGKQESAATAMKPGISEKNWGMIGTDSVKQYTLSNAGGMQVSILNYGGTVTNIIVPDRNKQMGDVVLGFDSLSGYTQAGNPYFGCLVGRYANRIASGKFTLDGKTYQLAQNNMGNALHGGLKGFDKVIWQATPLGDSSLQLVYNSKDGEEGYPGNLKATVVYTLQSDNSLKIDYTATTDQPTPVNLTNHSYFNLSAGKEPTILNHEVMIHADKFTEVNDKLIPTGKLPDVKGTPMDFTSAKPVGKELAMVKGGYDHNWVLNRTGSGLEKIASVYDPSSGRLLEVSTTEPGIQFYTGNFLDSTLHGKNNRVYPQHAALCLETQHFPDSPNQPSFPNAILKPGETYRHTTVFTFSVK
ncbi:MAG: galactose mutarotase [Chitinophagaceae bacterium]|nr:galactose mutarotase [Chitinophagaceae bacterium]